MRINKIFFLILFFFVVCLNAFGQKNDSIGVVFRAIGNGDRFKIYYNGEMRIKVRLQGQFVDTVFQIPRLTRFENGDHLYNLIITRKGKWGLKYRDTQIQVAFEDKPYLILEKNPFLKNRIAIQYHWVNERPRTQVIKTN